jgi:peptidyl-prolyl cis-trans isomerase C
MHYKRFLLGIVALGITLSFYPAGAYAAEKNADSQVIAEVGDKTIKYGDLNKWIKMMPPSYKSMFSNMDQMKKLLDRQIENTLFSEEAKRLKLDQNPSVKDKIEEFTKGILMQALIEAKVSNNSAVSEKEIEEYFKTHQDEFRVPEKIKVSQILIKVDANASAKVKEEKKAQAEELLAKAKKGEDFSALALQYSEDKKTKKKGGVVGLFARGSKDQEFEKAAFNLKENEISDPVLTKDGYSIIKLLKRKEAKTKSLKEASSRIENKLKQKKRNEVIEKLVKDLKSKTKVVVHEDVLKKIVEGSKEK